MDGYDIIGDVHGEADKLRALLEHLGYSDHAGWYQHRSRQAIFVGDLIDRGWDQVGTLKTVQRMVDAGAAQVVMGNHEFNAIAWATRRPGHVDEYLRKHNVKNKRQHQAFLNRFSDHGQEEMVQWFRTLPLWLDLGGVRIVHACWHLESIDRLTATLGGNQFTDLEQIVLASTEGNDLFDAIEVILKGPELRLAGYELPGFFDKGDHLRGQARVRWWFPRGEWIADLVDLPTGTEAEDRRPYPDLDGIRSHAGDQAFAYPGSVPVVYGHYWRKWPATERLDWTPTTACVDFSAAVGGPLVAYRWSGETAIDPDHYVAVGAEPSPTSAEAVPD